MLASEPMTSTPEDQKHYRIRFKDGERTDVVAGTVNAPRGIGTSEDNNFYLFTLNGDVVAKFQYQDVSGWQRLTETGRPWK